MRAELKGLHSPDIDDLESFRPENPLSFSFLLQAMFGPEGSRGEESFDIMVCTPTWLATTKSYEPVMSGLHHLIVRNYNFPELKDFLSSYARNCAGATWDEVAGKLAFLGKWEFQDYRPEV